MEKYNKIYKKKEKKINVFNPINLIRMRQIVNKKIKNNYKSKQKK